MKLVSLKPYNYSLLSAALILIAGCVICPGHCNRHEAELPGLQLAFLFLLNFEVKSSIVA